MNKVIMVGRLTREPETRTTNTEKTASRFNIAVKKAGNKDGADFFPVVAWNRLAETCGNNLVKGQRVLVEGRVQIRDYERSDGTRSSIAEIIASGVKFMEKPRGAGEAKNNQNDLPF
jgi:single-strand DNA-binding protein